jgi:heme exporter protein A
MSEGSIEVEEVSRRYGRRWALSGVSFRVPPGSVMMVAGHNGAGKSTLFRILATAIRPDRGKVTIGGFDVVRHREDVRKITAILSHANYLYESLTARENLRVVADHMGGGDVEPALAQVGLAGRGDDVISTFSAGMRKRLSFARVLLQNPRVVLLDEPYGALDPAGFELVDDVIRALRANGTTILMATHQWERGERLADLKLVLEAGKVIESTSLTGSGREVGSAPPSLPGRAS